MDGDPQYKLCKRGHLKTPENTSKDGHCKECSKLFFSEWRKKNVEKIKEGNVRFRVLHPDKNKRYNDRAAKELKKGYVAVVLDIHVNEITDELYELKKDQLLLFRAIRELNKTIKELSE